MQGTKNSHPPVGGCDEERSPVPKGGSDERGHHDREGVASNRAGSPVGLRSGDSGSHAAHHHDLGEYPRAREFSLIIENAVHNPDGIKGLPGMLIWNLVRE